MTSMMMPCMMKDVVEFRRHHISVFVDWWIRVYLPPLSGFDRTRTWWRGCKCTDGGRCMLGWNP